MTAIDRRSLLGAAAVATIGLALMPNAAESAPLTIGRSLGRNAEDLIEKTQVPPPGRRWGRRRWVCWWHRGRRVCGWR
jgi:hypothetical protein